ncbi:MAG: acyl carrier protein [Rhodospirillaceae bacterium]|nr:acyl carrier protein [Rhodospirillales bacterium]
MTEDEIRQRVLRAIRKALPRKDVTADARFEDLGIESLDAMSLIFAVEEEFDIDLTDTPGANIRGVNDVVREVLALVSPKDAIGA